MPVPLVDAVLGTLLDVVAPEFRLLTGLTPSELFVRRTQIISQFLPQLLRGGLSGRGALSIFRQAGLGVGNSAFFGKGNLFRVARSAVDAQDYISALPPGEAIDFTQAHGVHMLIDDEYAVRVWGEWQDPITGEWKGKWITVGVREGESLGDIEERLYESLSIWYAEGEFIEDIDWTVKDFIHAT